MNPFRILTVCTANVCRSPMTELLLRHRLDPEAFVVRSAGTHGWKDAPVDSMVVLELARWGVSADGFSSRALVKDDLEWADLILTATRAQRAFVLDWCPAALRRTFTLREFASLAEGARVPSPGDLVEDAYLRRSEASADADVADPFRRPPSVHRGVADEIAAAVDVIADGLDPS